MPPPTRPKLAKKISSYRELFENAPVAYLTLNLRGLIRLANLTATRLLGAAHEVLLKQPLASFLGQANADSYRSIQQRLVKTGQPQSVNTESFGRTARSSGSI